MIKCFMRFSRRVFGGSIPFTARLSAPPYPFVAMMWASERERSEPGYPLWLWNFVWTRFLSLRARPLACFTRTVTFATTFFFTLVVFLAKRIFAASLATRPRDFPVASMICSVAMVVVANYTNAILASALASPFPERLPSLVIRVYPPCRDLYLGAISFM